MIRTWLGSIEKYFLWAEAVNSVVYIKNRLPYRALDKTTPFEKLFGQKPLIIHLQPFGRKCYVHIPEVKRPSRTSLHYTTAIDGIFVGYTDSNKIYQVTYPPNEL